MKKMSVFTLAFLLVTLSVSLCFADWKKEETVTLHQLIADGYEIVAATSSYNMGMEFVYVKKGTKLYRCGDLEGKESGCYLLVPPSKQ
jgi:hypothetical protein